MEVARDPSDTNIKLWLSYLDKKNYLAERLKERIAQYASKTTESVPRRLANERISQLNQVQSAIDPSRYRVRTYFDSNCPHCKRMLGTLKSLQELGVFVEALQIDRDTSKNAQFPIATVFADQSDVQRQKIGSVPFTLVADLKNKTVSSPITGFKSVEDMKQAFFKLTQAQN